MNSLSENPEFLELAKKSGYPYTGVLSYPLVMEHALLGLLFSTWPTTVLEYGTFKGWSACLMAWALRRMGGVGKKLFSVDQRDQTEASTEAKALGLQDLVEFRQSVTWEFRHEVEMYDFVFLDASHDYQGWKREWFSIKPHIHDQTLVVVHDTLSDENWERFVSEELLPYNPFLLPMTGLTLLRKDARHVVDKNWKLQKGVPE